MKIRFPYSYLKRMQNVPESTHPEGFTLLEVLIALAIFGMSLAVILGMFSQSLDRTSQYNKAMQARLLAQSLLAEAQLNPLLRYGKTSGTTDAGLIWELQVEAFGTPEDRASWGMAPKKLTVMVRENNESKRALVTLSTLRLLQEKSS